jgi:hypothetical protein
LLFNIRTNKLCDSCCHAAPAGEQLFDNNSGQDFTYPTAAGITWEEWQAAALERQAEQEKERQAAEEVREISKHARCWRNGCSCSSFGGWIT